MKRLFTNLILITLGLAGHSVFAQTAATSTTAESSPATTASYGETTTTTTTVSSGKPPVSLRIVGSNLMNPQGQYLGRIEEAMLSTRNQLEFALIATAYPTNDAVLTPVPWSLLNHAWDQSKAGGTPGAVQTFLAPVDKAKLALGPKISRNHRTDLPGDFVQQVYAYYGASPGEIGATGSSSTTVSGGATGGSTTASTGTAATPSGVVVGGGDGVAVPPVVYTDPSGLIVALPGTNTLTNSVLGTNALATNGLFTGGTNVFPGGTNVFPGASNVFPGAANPIGGTNGFQTGTTNGNQGGAPGTIETNSGAGTSPGNRTNSVGRPALNNPFAPTSPRPFNPPPNAGVQNPGGNNPGVTTTPSTGTQDTAPTTGTSPSSGTQPSTGPRPTPMAPSAIRR
ncbi:MAG TPA: hypothetical protein VMZ27_16465 [Candidatus Saccharimonadales bacterium]|nr:hypothetical protein [Candidatus Saccharimonadales bacterium]